MALLPPPNIYPCEEREGRRFRRRPWRTPCPPHPRALPYAPPNNMLIVTSLLKPYATALLPRQHHVCRSTPTTALTPQQYRWQRRPRHDGSVACRLLICCGTDNPVSRQRLFQPLDWMR
jgi:hypothetical protein